MKLKQMSRPGDFGKLPENHASFSVVKTGAGFVHVRQGSSVFNRAVRRVGLYHYGIHGPPIVA